MRLIIDVEYTQKTKVNQCSHPKQQLRTHILQIRAVCQLYYNGKANIPLNHPLPPDWSADWSHPIRAQMQDMSLQCKQKGMRRLFNGTTQCLK